MENNHVVLSVENGVGIVTLNRPEVGNALDLQMAKELMEVALQCSDREDIRAVVITGAGNKFSVGGDLKSFAAQGEDIGFHLKTLTSYLNQAISTFARMNKPLIGAVNGTAAGAGMSLSCACDLVYASDQANFVMAYNQVGLTPDGSGSYYLPRLVGTRRALELLYTNRKLRAGEACEWGLVNQVVVDNELKETVLELAAKLAQGPVHAYGATRRLIAHSQQETLEGQLALESEQLATRANSVEGQEGIAAFMEKRAAKYVK
ncbi:enoyl-CoA hydratase/isomerase family protein [Desertibacillus haloalkaliphilus]|uniref:enoyl-CoA hydratase/isomerase family protein n=1 Tax=Desertibacillus haloalkaliphilus TaxID=1328930 RepID=UPI001C251582|nr:enoyl-CoA hydratase/isomerase family protein [Desertibacillus haloalkaliphilus]MBU8907581.1 enoyl-CoA hydratase/isomerase family protein [Desertibacillus haloalkaliphilus]